jgi:MFS family permease
MILPDWPSTTKWLTPEEKVIIEGTPPSRHFTHLPLFQFIAVQRLAHDGIGNTGAGGDEPTHWEAAKMALTDWRTYMLVVMYMLATGSQTIQYFIPTLVSQLGYKGFMAQYMTIPIYMVALVGILTFCFISDWRKERGNYITLTACIAGVSFIVTVASNNDKVKYAFLCFAVGGVYACCPLTLLVCLTLLSFCCRCLTYDIQWVSSIIDHPAEKRAIAIAFVNGLGNS